MDIVIIAFVLIFIFSIKKCEMSCNLSKENTTIYKGFFTICVILGHLSQILGGVLLQRYIGKYNYWDFRCLYSFSFPGMG